MTAAVLILLMSVGMGVVGVSAAIASSERSAPSKVIALNTNVTTTEARTETSANEASPQTVAQSVEPASTPTEIDTSITREYEPVTIYLPDSTSQELVPQSVLVTTDAPVTMAVNQIVDQYEGQDVGIMGYEVNVDTQAREAAINFEVNDPRGEDVFQSLSSANQYSLFEAIRETLLTQPVYGIDEVIFQANDTPFNI
ncbi:MAG: hypothetical protein AAFX78_04740 [Cyanobacteria bacterium J06638_20]